MGHDSAKLSHEDAKMGHDGAKIAIFSSACEVLGCFWEHSGTILPHELDCKLVKTRGPHYEEVYQISSSKISFLLIYCIKFP